MSNMVCYFFRCNGSIYVLLDVFRKKEKNIKCCIYGCGIELCFCKIFVALKSLNSNNRNCFISRR